MFATKSCVGLCVFLLILLICTCASGQSSLQGKILPGTPKTDLPTDALGRSTPRGTVMGFLVAARKGQYEVASQYLNTRQHGKAAVVLAYQLAVVLDRLLPAKLNQLSDVPQGSLSLLRTDQDLVGTVTSGKGDVDILLDRVEHGNASVWLFSNKTLDSIPDIYEELDIVNVDAVFPSFLVHKRLFGIPAYEWLVVFIGIPMFYFLLALLNRLLRPYAGRVRRRLKNKPDLPNPEILPTPIRLFLLALTIRWLLSEVSLSLLARQFWSSVSAVIAIAGTVWLLILVSSQIEEYMLGRFSRQTLSGAASILRLTRRIVNVLILFAGLLLTLHYFGVNPTAALAGLGVGGIAVALAAQKTLENVIGGVSLIADRALHVGDTLKVGEISGTVEEIGLRSTRIRTFDRTLVTVPNGQIANAILETLSARDKFWFHPLIGLRYGTSAEQLGSVLEGIRELLAANPSLDKASVRARLLAFGSSSLDIDVCAYVHAQDWNHFLEIQETLLVRVLEVVETAGTQIALPSQITYLNADAVCQEHKLKNSPTRTGNQTTGEAVGQYA